MIGMKSLAASAAILPLGDPRLRVPSEAVTLGEPTLNGLMRQMAEALAAFQSVHGWGRALASPQLGIAKRIIVLDLGAGPFFMINPTVEWRSPEQFELWDDCMCAPSIAVRVLRSRSLTVRFSDEQGRTARFEKTGESVSELLQHELDHLDGVILTDRMLSQWGVVSREARPIAKPMDNPALS